MDYEAIQREVFGNTIDSLLQSGYLKEQMEEESDDDESGEDEEADSSILKEAWTKFVTKDNVMVKISKGKCLHSTSISALKVMRAMVMMMTMVVIEPS